MGWLLEAIWSVFVAALEMLGAKHDLVKEETNAKPRSDVL